MKRSSLVAVLLVVSTATASADNRKILVLQSEGKVDGGMRAKIDASIFKLARGISSADVSPGDTTLSDAAAAVGCKPDTVACRDEILGMLSVDELVITTLTTKPGGTEIEVHRVSKGGSSSDAKMILAIGSSPDKLDGLAPLFGGKASSEPVATLPPLPQPDPIAPPGTDPVGSPSTMPPPPVSVADTTSSPALQPAPSPAGPSDDSGRGRRRLELGGMIGGGALVLIGFMCWGSANDIQSQINDSPTQTKPQLDALARLESRGDSYAGAGNVLFLGGAIIGGISTYFFIKDRRANRHTSTARITPTVLDHGAGIALTFGAAP